MKSASNSGDAQWPSRLFDTYDHTGNMAALGALATPATMPSYDGNVIPLHG